MAIICWGGLGKAANNTTTIDEEITEYIRLHDENINAHMGEDYSLGAHRLQVSLDHPANSVNYFHVKDIHAEAITAGGMVVKGGGPYISVQDGEGVERVLVYPEGIIVKEGKISVENEGNKEIIDGRGLRGGNIFYSGENSLSAESPLTGSNKWYPFPPLEFGVYMSRSTPILVFGNIKYWVNGEENDLNVAIQHNAVYSPALSGWSFMVPVGETRIEDVFSFNRILQLYAGANLIRPVFKATTVAASGAGISAGDQLSNFGYVILGN